MGGLEGDPAVGGWTCTGCGELIDRDETVLIRSEDDTYHVSALAAIPEAWLETVVAVWHADCFTEDLR